MKRTALALLIFAGVALLFFRGAAFLGRTEIPCNPNRWEPWVFHATEAEKAPPAVNSDAALAYYPRRVFATDRIQAGDLPLWDPTTFTGQPFLANFQSSLLYPLAFPFWFGDPKATTGWFLIAHFALAGMLAFWCARSLGISVAGAVAAGLVFELNAFLLTRVGHPTFVATATWTPLVVMTGFYLGRKPGVRSACALAASLAMTIYAGFPQTAIHLFYVAAWIVAWSVIVAPAARKLPIAIAGAGAVGLSIALAAAQLLPSIEFLSHSTRDPMDLPTFLSGCHHPGMLLRLAVPDMFGNPMDGNLWSTLLSTGNGYFAQNYVSTINYFGILPLAVGVVGLVRGKHKVIFGGLIVLPLLVVWGTPLATASWYLPGFKFSRVDRLMSLPFFAMAMGFGFGIDRLCGGSFRGRMSAIAIAAGAGIVALVVIAFDASLVQTLSRGRIPEDYAAPAILRSGSTTLILAVAAIALLLLARRVGRGPFLVGAILLAAADLFLFGSRFHLDLPARSTFLETPEIKKIRSDLGPHGRFVRYGHDSAHFLPPATASVFGISDVAGIGALNLSRYRHLMEALEPGLYERRRYGPLRRSETLHSPLLRLLGASPYSMGRTGRLLRGGGGDPLSRATLHHDWEVVEDSVALQRISSPSFAPEGKVFLAGDAPPPPLARGRGTADITLYEPDRVDVATSCESTAVLLVTDAWYPGWEATIDGDPAPIVRANYAFRGVIVPQGDHVIEFRYRPDSFRSGVVITGTALVVIAILLSIPLALRKAGA